VHHNFLVVTVKKGLKSVYIYRSYYKNKLGGSVFLDHPVDTTSKNFIICITTHQLLNSQDSELNWYDGHIEQENIVNYPIAYCL